MVLSAMTDSHHWSTNGTLTQILIMGDQSATSHIFVHFHYSMHAHPMLRYAIFILLNMCQSAEDYIFLLLLIRLAFRCFYVFSGFLHVVNLSELDLCLMATCYCRLQLSLATA